MPSSHVSFKLQGKAGHRESNTTLRPAGFEYIGVRQNQVSIFKPFTLKIERV